MHVRNIRLIAAAAALLASAGLSTAALAATAQHYKHPSDTPYPGGTLSVHVDLTRAPDRIFQVHETIPVAKPGPFTIYYPRWIPGEHGPSGPIGNVTGPIITANGKQIPWQRDTRGMYTLHMNVPAGVKKLELNFQFLSPASGGSFGASSSTDNNLVDIEFNQVAFYPAGYYARQVEIQPTVTLPKGWMYATALRTESQSGNVVTFKPVSFNNFVDSPLIAGKYFNRVDLAPGAKVPVHLNIVGDSAASVVMTKQQVTDHRNLVKQILALFGSHHFQHYDFLLTVSDHVGHFGLEHHQSSDDRLGADALTNPSSYLRSATLMPHEWVHSWNGKFRRPYDLWTPNFNMVKRDDLLWVYEGLTDYWAGVLTTRSGMWTPAQYRAHMAMTAAEMSERTGRRWRSLQDTATAGRLTYYKTPYNWRNWRRGTDFYPEGQLLWLDVDTKIRELSHGRRSLDDFAHAFYGMDNGSYVTRTYTYQDVIDTLNKVQPYDWNAFLRQRLDYTGPNLPETGFARGGWKLVYTDQQSKAGKALARDYGLNLASSAGLSLGHDGSVTDVQWDGPAFKAGVVPGMTVVAVNGKHYSDDVMKQAVKDAVGSKAPITLLVKNIDQYRTLKIDYHGGLKYPHLVRVKGTRDRLDRIVKAR